MVEGVLRACAADPELRLLLVGPTTAADEVAAGFDAASRVPGRAETLAVDALAATSDLSIMAGRRYTTVRVAVEALAEGSAQAVVSAGASGAAVAAAAHRLGRFPGLRRPGLAATVPSSCGPVVLLDVGAVTDPTDLDLLWYAVLGAAYANIVEGIRNPRVGLLSIGTESGKGDRLRRSVASALPDLPLPAGGRYVGLVEGHDVPAGGPADVVVTDGFTGNVLLKGMEGAYALAAAGEPVPQGAPRAAALLGVRGTVVVCHGAAAASDVAAGIELAARLYRLQMSATLSAVASELFLGAR